MHKGIFGNFTGHGRRSEGEKSNSQPFLNLLDRSS